LTDKQGIGLNSCVLLHALCRRLRIFVQIPYRYLEETCKKSLALSTNSDIIETVNYKFAVPCCTVLKVYIVAEERAKKEELCTKVNYTSILTHFNILCTLHLRIILVDKQLDTQFIL
jgi:hypothetical protein